MNSEPTRRPKVLVTGAAGNFARRIVDGLSNDFDLVLTDVPEVAAAHTGMIPVDLLDYDAVQRVIAGIDMVVHLAISSYYRFKNPQGQTYNDELMRVNLIGTQHVFEAASRVGIRRFVYASSMTIDIGTLAPWPVDRDNPPRPSNLYGCTKLFGEQLGEMYARQNGMSVVCLRFGQPFPLGRNSDPAQLALPRVRGLLVAFADIEQAVRCALTWPGIGYKVARIVSASTPANVDLTAAAEIGYQPCRRFTQAGEEPVAAKQPPAAPCNSVGEAFRVAAIITTYFPLSHADVIVSRWLEPRAGDADWGWPQPQSRIVSAYIDQIGEDDMGCEILERNEVPIYDTIEQALIADGELRVDAVLLIGEHGEYGKNELGQLLYPRKELFDQIVAAYRRVGQCAPVFCDKFLSWNFEWAVDMVRTAFEMNFLLFGGSSVPLCQLSTPFRLAQGVKSSQKEAVVVFHGPDEPYGYHSLEFVQPLIDSRPGGESGVHMVTAWRGDDVWRELEAGTWSEELMAAAIAAADAAGPTEVNSSGNIRADCAADGGPMAFQMSYDDGITVTHINLDGHIKNWGIATFLEDDTINATAPIMGGDDSHHGHFATLCRVIEESFQSGRQQYPPSRLLLTTGQTAAVMQALAQPGQPLFTPELLIRYNAFDLLGWHDDGSFGAI